MATVSSLTDKLSNGHGRNGGDSAMLHLADPSLVKVIKREGNIVPYDSSKILRAVSLCFQSIFEESPTTFKVDDILVLAKIVTDQVDTILRLKSKQLSEEDGYPAPVGIEAIQDIVESQLMALGHYDAAKHYILYRDERRRVREESRGVSSEAKQFFKDGCSLFRGTNRLLQEVQAFDKFSRFQWGIKRREIWPETCDRVMRYYRNHVEKIAPGAIPEETWAALNHGLLHQQATGSLRGVQMAGPALERCQSGVFNCSFLFMDSPESMAEDLYLLMQGCGVGFSVEEEYAVDKWPRVHAKRDCAPLNYTVEDDTEAWCDAVKFGWNHWLDGADVKFDLSPIRPAGAILRTKGGRASGPRPLQDLLNFDRDLIFRRQKQRLRSIDIHDATCMLHRVGQMGGVRRASGISFSDRLDMLLRNAKQGEFFNLYPWRNQANNSAVYTEKPSAVEFMEEWLSLAKSGSGERGIFNEGSLGYQIPARRRPGIFRGNPCMEIYLRNRQFCVSGDTHLITKDGITTIENAVGQEIEIWNGEKWSKVTPFQTGENVDLYRVLFSDGSYLDVTGYHGFSVSNIDTRFRGKNRVNNKSDGFVRKNTLELMETVHKRWGTEPFRMEHTEGEDVPVDLCYDLGFAVGDGFRVGDRVSVDLYGEKDWLCPVRGDRGAEYFPEGYSASKKRVVLDPLITVEKLKSLRSNPDSFNEMFSWSRQSILSFIAGWVDADGSETGTGGVRLYLSGYGRALRVQLLLLKCGIRSSVCLLQEAGTETNLGTRKQDLYYLQITECQDIPSHRVSTVGGHAPKIKGKFQTIRDIIPLPGKHKSFCFTESEKGKGVFGTTLTYQCNLSISIVDIDDTFEEILRKVILATIWGTIQASMTRFRYLRPSWKETTEEDALLGVDILGHMDCKLLKPGAPGREEILQRLRQAVIDTNLYWARRLGINPGAALTCGKPSGDSSVFFDKPAGLKAHHGKFWVRRLRFEETNPVAKVLKDAKIPWQYDYDKTGICVFEFPCKAPDGAIVLGDMSAIEQLENWKTWKVNFTEHNPSCTVSVKDHEWIETGNWVYQNWDIVGGLSFYPLDDSIYPLTPYEKIEEEEYRQRSADMPEDIDWSRILLYEHEDETTLAGQIACTGPGCDA